MPGWYSGPPFMLNETIPPPVVLPRYALSECPYDPDFSFPPGMLLVDFMVLFSYFPRGKVRSSLLFSLLLSFVMHFHPHGGFRVLLACLGESSCVTRRLLLRVFRGLLIDQIFLLLTVTAAAQAPVPPRPLFVREVLSSPLARCRVFWSPLVRRLSVRASSSSSEQFKSRWGAFSRSFPGFGLGPSPFFLQDFPCQTWTSRLSLCSAVAEPLCSSCQTFPLNFPTFLRETLLSDWGATIHSVLATLLVLPRPFLTSGVYTSSCADAASCFS